MAGSERKRTFPCESNSRNYANRTIKQERRIMFTIEREKWQENLFYGFFPWTGGVWSHETRLICCKLAVWFILLAFFAFKHKTSRSLVDGKHYDEILMSNCSKIPLISPRRCDGTELMTFEAFALHLKLLACFFPLASQNGIQFLQNLSFNSVLAAINYFISSELAEIPCASFSMFWNGNSL